MPGGGGEAGRERKEGMETVRREWAEERGKREEVEGGRGEGGKGERSTSVPEIATRFCTSHVLGNPSRVG